MTRRSNLTLIRNKRPKAKTAQSTGNIFEDIGVPNADEHALKADVVIKIGKIIASKSLSQVKAAGLTGVSQPDLSRLLRGDFDGFSMDRLLKIILDLGSDIEINVKRPVENRKGHARVLAEAFA